MDEAATEADVAKRNKIYHEFQKKIVEASPIVFIHELKFVTVYNKKFANLIVSPLGIYTSFADAYEVKK